MNTPAPDFVEIYELYPVPFWQSTPFIVGCITLAVFGIALCYYLFFMKKRRQMTAWQWATTELEKLNPEECRNKNDFKKFYFSLSSIFKKYLAMTHKWNTVDKTDDELINFLSQHEVSQTVLEPLKKITSHALWIKFANHDALKTEAVKDLATMITLIEHLKPTPKKPSDRV